MPLAAPPGQPGKGGNFSRLLLPVLIFFLCGILLGIQFLAYFGLENVRDAVGEALHLQRDVRPVVASVAPVKPQHPPKNNQVKVSPALSPEAAVPPFDNKQPPVVQPPAPPATPATGQQISEGVTRGVPGAGKKIALTFDDGPSLEYTPLYLQVLRENNVHATFFLVGREIQRSPGLAAMIAAEGHDLGNHTFDHPNLKSLAHHTIRQQIARTTDILEQVTQRPVKYFRPPGGNLNQAVKDIAGEMGLQLIMWNIDPRDWERNKTPEQIVNNIMNNLRPGGIVVLHERKPQTLAALPVLIGRLREQGWEPVTLTELLTGSGTTGEPVPANSESPALPASGVQDSQEVISPPAIEPESGTETGVEAHTTQTAPSE